MKMVKLPMMNFTQKFQVAMNVGLAQVVASGVATSNILINILT